MGWISGLVKIASGIIKPLLGIAAPAVIAAPIVTRAALPAVTRAASRVLGTLGRGAATLPGQVAIGIGAGALGAGLVAGDGAGGVPIGAGGAPLMAGGAGALRGNGRFARQTIVQTIDLVTKTVARTEVFSGAPFLMNNEVRKLRTVARKVARANGRLPRRTVRQSDLSALKDNLVRQALTGASCPPSPPKC